MRSERYSSLPEPIMLDRVSGVPLHVQISRYFRDLISSGKLAGGALPSTRALARELQCSRNTVVQAYDQLAAEGFFQSQARSATVISLPAARTREQLDEAATEPASGMVELSRAAQTMATVSKPDLERFTTLSPIPNFEIFPFKIWTRIYKSVWQDPSREVLFDRDPMGYLPLRAALAKHLQISRGLKCDASNIVITSGTTQSLSLIMNCLLEPGDDVWLENPCFAEAIALMRLSAMQIHPVEVDTDGLSVRDGLAKAPNARMCLVAPTHQFPLGMTMSLERRLELLAWAGRARAWIIEDDYDSELIWSSRTIPALQSLSPDSRVIYVGSFNKSLLPNLRIGYIVAHPEVATSISRAKVFLNGPTSMQIQPVLADFIAEGHLARHLSRAASLYQRQRALALESVDRHLGTMVEPCESQRGIHLTTRFAGPALGLDDCVIEKACGAEKLAVRRLSQYYIGGKAVNGLVFGFASAGASDFDQSMMRLGKVLRAHL